MLHDCCDTLSWNYDTSPYLKLRSKHELITPEPKQIAKELVIVFYSTDCLKKKASKVGMN